jgi:cytochrome c peroxidase
MSAIPILPPVPYDYVTLNLPAHFTTTSVPFADVTPYNNTPIANPITNDGATLGRVLFYDKNLSFNNTIACGSCHQQKFAFSDTAVHSLGFNGGFTRRHSMPLINVKWHKNGKMFWDERASSVEDQALKPIQDVVEMGLTLPLLVQRVQQQSYYPQLFQNAFGDTAVTTTRISYAIAQFVRSIVSYQSKYDIGRSQVTALNQTFPNFTTSENQGKNIFYRSIAAGGGECFGCHTSEAFINAQFGPMNNGLDSLSITDLGAFEPNQIDSTLIGRFKVSTLRNIALTAPYMHDGRFATLQDVVNHYSTGIKLHRNLSPRFIDTVGTVISAHKFNFTTAQKTAIVDFLKTLTDSTILTEVKWSDPFAITTSVANNLTIIQFSLYPNPSTDFITLKADGATANRIAVLEIRNLNGQKMYSQKTYFTTYQEIKISEFPDGVYFLILKIGDKSTVKKFIKT